MTLVQSHDFTEVTDRSAPADEPPRLMTASKLLGSKVLNRQDETLGQIDDIVFAVPRGSLAYAAMASGGILGLGERLFAVPWSALIYDAGRECFVLNAQKESFEHAPGFDKDRWPTEAGAEWHEQVHRYYGAPLHWQRDHGATP
jgi:sporulation protein YlmC with PRC-barrel domain